MGLFLKIIIGNDTITTTPNHLFLHTEWMEAGKLISKRQLAIFECYAVVTISQTAFCLNYSTKAALMMYLNIL